MNYLSARLARLYTDEGGWLGAALAGAGLFGKLFGDQAKGAADGRLEEAKLGLARDSLGNQQFNTQQNAQMDAGRLDLDRQKFGTDNRGALGKQALIGHLLGGGIQPTQINTPGIKPSTMQGGLVRALLSNPEALAAMKTMGGQASEAQNTPLSFQGGQLLTPRPLSQTPQASGWEKLAGILGIGGTLAGGVGQVGDLLQGGGGMASGPSSQGAVADNLKRIVGNTNFG